MELQFQRQRGEPQTDHQISSYFSGFYALIAAMVTIKTVLTVTTLRIMAVTAPNFQGIFSWPVANVLLCMTYAGGILQLVNLHMCNHTY